ncbi:Cytochrome c oxidase copper chaperone [Folsomia candida]|uniref:Cytochrome c oxidase copper chaperone n=1 Tax=Folsomia candida TaxID=158441 RepID=A0A226DQ70_FOLCA|nr:Cytochrome c oxidase copper chaperone [Folsomia candida]
MPEMTKCEGAVNKEQKPCSDKSKCTKADSATPPAPTEQKKLKPCCACPETKKPRDQWMKFAKDTTSQGARFAEIFASEEEKTHAKVDKVLHFPNSLHIFSSSDANISAKRAPWEVVIVEHGEENCTELIEAHKQCMRKMGFNI